MRSWRPVNHNMACCHTSSQAPPIASRMQIAVGFKNHINHTSRHCLVKKQARLQHDLQDWPVKAAALKIFGPIRMIFTMPAGLQDDPLWMHGSIRTEFRDGALGFDACAAPFRLLPEYGIGMLAAIVWSIPSPPFLLFGRHTWRCRHTIV